MKKRIICLLLAVTMLFGCASTLASCTDNSAKPDALVIKTENLERTANNLIFVEHDTPYTRTRIDEMLDVLRDAIRVEEDTLTCGTVKRAMMELVPTFHDPEEVNRSAESCDEMKLASR